MKKFNSDIPTYFGWIFFKKILIRELKFFSQQINFLLNFNFALCEIIVDPFQHENFKQKSEHFTVENGQTILKRCYPIEHLKNFFSDLIDNYITWYENEAGKKSHFLKEKFLVQKLELKKIKSAVHSTFEFLSKKI